MEKINCIEDYFLSTKAYYMFHIGRYKKNQEYLDYILDKKYIIGAKVSFISNIMLGIKEDLIDIKGAMDYRSKLFIDKLERSVDFIADKVENGYKLSNYVFPDAASLVAIVRNKLAHGKYIIDFEHNRVILNHKGTDIVINVEKLIGFVMTGFIGAYRDAKTPVYEREMVYYQKNKNDKEEPIKDINTAKRIIKKFDCVKFKLESKIGIPVFADCIKYLEVFLKKYRNNPIESLKSDYYKKMLEYFEKSQCKLSIEYSKLKDKKQIDKMLDFIGEQIVGNPYLDYDNQIKFIGSEVQRAINNDFNNFNAISSNINNLIILNAISHTNSVDTEIISIYIGRIHDTGIRFGHDEYGASLISMFNSLFVYPFDDVFETTGEYKTNREGSFDFSKLDLTMIKPNIINIDDSPLKNITDRKNSLEKREIEIREKIKLQQQNLNRVKGNTTAENAINKNIIDLRNDLLNLLKELSMSKYEYTIIKQDYTDNALYFENRSIIEGIRNSIAHGNYEIVVNGNFLDTLIVFSDIYEGKTTFQVSIPFIEFENMINYNCNNVIDYVNNKGKSR